MTVFFNTCYGFIEFTSGVLELGVFLSVLGKEDFEVYITIRPQYLLLVGPSCTRICRNQRFEEADFLQKLHVVLELKKSENDRFEKLISNKRSSLIMGRGAGIFVGVAKGGGGGCIS